MTEQTAPEVLTVEEAAAYLRLDAGTVRELLRTGKLPGRKVGRVWRLLKSDLESYLRGDWQHDELR